MPSKNTKNIGSTGIAEAIARSDDGTIQITYTIDKELIEKEKKAVLEDLAKNTAVDGFRKGNAPVDKVAEKYSQETLVEKALQRILPKAFSETINKNKLKLAIIPKFEVISAAEDKAWEVRAKTCELPKFDLGNYREKVKSLKKAKIWTPGDKDEKPEENQQGKENAVLSFLAKETDIKIPNILIEEEVNSKLSSLLERVEKLGLNLESYLTSVGKTPQSLRSEYENQVSDSIKIELSLNFIAEKEGITANEKEIDEAIAAYRSDPVAEAKDISEEQKRLIASIVTRRKALDYLVNLI